MAIESKPKKPLVKALWKSQGPPGAAATGRAFKYKVKEGDNWRNLARRDQWAYTWDLIKFNFDTENAKEVNWYLRDFVGCNVSKDGGKNWSFSASADPGYVWTQNDVESFSKEHIPNPEEDYDPDTEYPGPTFDSGWWFGFGVKGGLSTPDLRNLGIPIYGVGAEVAVLQMVGLESLLEFYDGTAPSFGNWNRFVLNVDALRYDGKGLGGGGLGFVMGIINGISDPAQLRGYRVEGSDFNFSAGPLKSSYAKMAKAVAPLFESLGKNLLRALKQPSAWEQIALIAKGIKGALEQSANEGRNQTTVQVYDLPGIGAELSSFSFTGMTQVLLDNYTPPRARWEARQYPDL